METIMSKTNDTSRLATLEDHRPLADCELDAVSGGTSKAGPKLYEACCKGTHLPEVTIELW
jgi:type VI protein secretion system component Hcp